MKPKTYIKILVASFLLGIGISVVGCGSSGGGSNATPPAGNISSQVVVNGQTPNRCYSGFVTSAVDGAQVCQAVVVSEVDLNASYYGDIPRLSASRSNAMLTPALSIYPGRPIQIQPNDKLTIKRVSGGWGRGKFFDHSHCRDIDTHGVDTRNGSTVENETVPSGLFLSNGTGATPAFGPGVIYFNEAGTLRYGFNAPASVGNCYSLEIRFKLERCLDVASLPHKCK